VAPVTSPPLPHPHVRRERFSEGDRFWTLSAAESERLVYI